MSGREFLSGNDAFAIGVCLARPRVISAYPITPQTVVVERLSEMAENGSLDVDFIHVESEHSALSCAIGASAAGVRTFTATSSQGLLYMAECLPYASGGRFPIVMMNANRSIALPWNIYGDQSDSLSQLASGWIQAYAQDAQEALDLALMSFYIAEHPKVSTPYMVNLDGFHLTHTYEVVDIPDDSLADEFLPPYRTDAGIDFNAPKNMAFSAGPGHNAAFKYRQHAAMLRVRDVVTEAEARFAGIFGRRYSGLTEAYMTGDADYIIVTLGAVSGLCRDAADALRARGVKAGVLRIRYMRPFPGDEIARELRGAKAAAVLEKDISVGNAGAVFTETAGVTDTPLSNYIGGLGGEDIAEADILEIFDDLRAGRGGVRFLGIKERIDEESR
ncbi:MAG: pyruvate ferredoxin oxidoreductase [Oscillospiraceae bacterium]|jgi:pyruvate ferredoxin oxidoreductase alpha subunit|nr:pyruvate ferredoxin oxidoreductase [Oscillospiraceae bacterium]